MEVVTYIRKNLSRKWVINMKICFYHITGGTNNLDFYGYLTESTVKYYKDQGCEVNIIEWKKKMEYRIGKVK